MSERKDNGFESYELTPEELISGATFSLLQKMYIQTQRSAAAGDMVALDYDPNKPLEFVSARSFCKGFIAACDFFLDHENAEDAKTRWDELLAAQGRSPEAKD